MEVVLNNWATLLTGARLAGVLASRAARAGGEAGLLQWYFLQWRLGDAAPRKKIVGLDGPDPKIEPHAVLRFEKCDKPG